MENRTARLTLLIDPDKKRIFEDICAAQDQTPSQVVRRLIRQFILDNAGDRELPSWLRPPGERIGSTVAQVKPETAVEVATER